MTKLKVAVCVSGQMRNFEDCRSSMLQYFLSPDKYDLDFFISAWEKRGAKPRHEGSKGNKGEFVTESLLKLAYPNVKSVEIENFVKTCPPKLFNQIGILHPMYYKIWRADKLRREYEKKSGIQYDWVVRTRPDLMFRKDSEFSFEDLSPKVLYHSRGSLYKWEGDKYKLHWKKIRLSRQQYQKIYDSDKTIDKLKVQPPKREPVGLHDQIAIAKPEIITVYTDSWLYMDNWIKSKPRPKLPFHVRPKGACHAHELMIYRTWIHDVEVSPLNDLIYITYRG